MTAAAFGRVSAQGTLSNSSGLVSVVRRSRGTYRVTLTQPFSSPDYQVVPLVEDTGRNIPPYAEIDQRTLSTFDIQWRNSSNVLNDYDFTLTVYSSDIVKGDPGRDGRDGRDGSDSTVPGPPGRDGSDASVTSANIVRAVSGTPTNNQIIEYDSSSSQLQFVDPPSGGGGTAPTISNIISAIGGSPSDEQVLTYESTGPTLQWQDIPTPPPSVTPVPYVTGDPHYWVGDGEGRVLSLILHDVDITNTNRNTDQLLVRIEGIPFTLAWPIATADRRINIELSDTQATNINDNASGSVPISVALRQGTTTLQLIQIVNLPVIVPAKAIALKEDITSSGGGTTVVANPTTDSSDPAISSITIGTTDYRISGRRGARGPAGDDASVTIANIISAIGGSPSDEQVLTYESTGPTLEWQTVTSGGGTTVVANPSTDSSDPQLNSLRVGSTDYRVVGQKGDKGDRGEQGVPGRDSTVAGPAGPAGMDGRDGSDASVTSANIVRAVNGTPTDNQIIQYDSANSRLEFQDPPSGGGTAPTISNILSAIGGDPTDEQVLSYESTGNTLEWQSLPTPVIPVPYILGDPHYWVRGADARTLTFILHDIDIVESNKNVDSIVFELSGSSFTVVWPIATGPRRINIELNATQATNINDNSRDSVAFIARLRQGQDVVQTISGSLPVIVRNKSIALIEDIPTSGGSSQPAPVGVNQVMVPATISGEQSLVADGSYDIVVSTITAGPYATMGTSANAGKIVFSRGGILRLGVAITCRVSGTNGRAIPTLNVTGTGIQIMGRSNGYYRATNVNRTVFRSVDILVTQGAVGTLQLLNPTESFDPQTLLFTGFSHIVMFAYGGTAGRDGSDGADSTVAGPAGRDGRDGRDGSDASVTSANIVRAISGNPTDNQIIQYDSANSRLEFQDPPSGGSGGGIVEDFTSSFLISGYTYDSSKNVTLSTSTNLNPHGVTRDSDGNFWVVDLRDTSISKYSSTGVYDSSATINLSSANVAPVGLAIDPDGNFWVCDTLRDVLYSYTSSGSFRSGSTITLKNPENRSPLAMWIDDDGTFWVGDSSDKIFRYSSSGVFDAASTIDMAAGNRSPQGIARDPLGNFWVVDTSDKLFKYSPTGENDAAATINLDSSITDPTGLHIDSDGSIWVLDNNAPRRLHYYKADSSQNLASVTISEEVYSIPSRAGSGTAPTIANILSAIGGSPTDEQVLSYEATGATLEWKSLSTFAVVATDSTVTPPRITQFSVNGVTYQV